MQGAPPSKGYPALFWYSDGKATVYQGGRSTEDLVDFMVLRGGPFVKQLDTEDDAIGFRLSFPVTVIGEFFRGYEIGGAFATFQQVCERSATEAVRCGHLAANRAGADSVVLHRAIDDVSVPFTEGSLQDAEALSRFVLANQLPPVVQYDWDTRRALFESSIAVLVLLLRSSDGADNDHAEAFRQAARQFYGEAIFVNVEGQHAAALGPFFSSPDPPALVLYDKQRNRRHVLSHRDQGSDRPEGRRSEARDMADLLRRAFIAKDDDTLWVSQSSEQPQPQPHLCEEPVSSAVVTLVASTFTQAILGGEPRCDVLVLVHAPWCPSCKDLLGEIFPAVAARLTEEFTRVKVAAIDVMANELPPGVPEVLALPEVLLFRANASGLGDALLLDHTRGKPTPLDEAALVDFFRSHVRSVRPGL